MELFTPLKIQIIFENRKRQNLLFVPSLKKDGETTLLAPGFDVPEISENVCMRFIANKTDSY